MSQKHWLRTRAGQAVIALGLTGGVIALIVGLLWATNALGWRAWRLAEVEQFIGAALPAGANDTQFATQDHKTRIIWLRFSLPPDANLASFLGTIGLGDELRDGFTPFPAQNPAEAALTWWIPGAAQRYTGSYAVHNDRMVEVLVDHTDEPTRTIYLRVYALGM